MTDPLSVTAGAAGLISLGIQVTQSLVNYYNSYKGQDSDIRGMTERLECLLDIFQDLKKTITNRKIQADERGLLKNIETSIKNCDSLIRELQEECEKFTNTSSNGIKATIRTAGRRAIYPFRQSTLQKLDENIDEIRANLLPALGVLQLKDHKRTHNEIAEIKSLLDLVRTYQISSDLRDWLKAPDTTIDHEAACRKKHPGTGIWLTKSARFSRWLREENSILWLNGFAGSGKSVLCSTAIQSVLRHRRSDPRIGITFFYFTFNDKSKQDDSAMLRALLLQLSSQLQDGHTDLTRLHSSYKNSSPPSRVLMGHLRRLVERFQHVYIMLDALDESPRDRARDFVLDTLEKMREWGLQGLHFFITSRNEPDIHESLNLFSTQDVIMKNTGIDQDIVNFISSRLDIDRRLRKWLPYRNKIQNTLAERAKDVFRWVDCQFQSLRDCPRSEDHLDRLLNSLPQSLDETYERMLCGIEHSLIKDARRILTLLCFASRPLTVQELIDGIAMETNDPSGLNHRHKMQGADDIHTICRGFVEISLEAGYMTETYNERELIPTVRIAHFSVQEYLESERIRDQKAARFALTSATAHAEITQICLGYLLEPRLSLLTLDQNVLKEYPLAHFAAKFWYYHYINARNPGSKLDDFILKLFQQKESFASWVELHDMDRPWRSYPYASYASDDTAAPVYYASLLGLDQPLAQLICNWKSESISSPALSPTSITEVSKLVNAQGGFYGNALQAASREGHEKTVELLLDKGADVNAQDGDYGNALQAASHKGNEKVVQLLLDKGADINIQGGYYGNVLEAASIGGNKEVIQLLLDNGADINAQSGLYGSSLQAASMGGDEKVVQQLLDNGATVSSQSGFYGNALQTASNKGHEKVVQLLLDKGADIHAQGGHYGNALQAASFSGYEKMVQVLLDRGAEVNARGGSFGTALQAASYGGHEKVVQVLLDRGAEVNAQGGKCGNALQAASWEGNKEVVQLLLDRGADISLSVRDLEGTEQKSPKERRAEDQRPSTLGEARVEEDQ